MPMKQFNHIQLLRYAGFFTYLCVGTPLLRYPGLMAAMREQGRSPVLVDLWLVCYLLFGLVFWFLTHRLGARQVSPAERLLQIALLLVLNGTAVVIGLISQSGLCALLLVVVAVVLPWLLPLRSGLFWAVAQNYTLVPVWLSFHDTTFTLAEAVLQSSLYLGFSVLAFVTSVIAKQQGEEREQQRRLNAELRATRALLAESSRLGERMRISRDLHDLMGHHLTALSLNLEVAAHLAQGQAQEHVRKAQTVAKLLLNDVREVVSQLRDGDNIDLTAALRSLIEGVPQLAIHLDLPERFSIEDPRRAQVLLRCAQEIITNTVRHSGARNLWLSFVRTEDRQLAIHARDDGRGAADLTAGNGLRGMRERLAEFGGRLDVNTSRGRGFTLDAWLPLEVAT